MALDGVNNNGQQQQVDPNLVKKSGVQFGKNTLKSLEEISIHNSSSNGTLERIDGYKATLTDGTFVQFPKQKQGAKILKTGDNQYDFEKLNKAEISGTDKNNFYNLMGCSFTDVFVNDYDKTNYDSDTVNIGDHGDGTKSKGNTVYVDEHDSVEKGNAYFYGHEGWVDEWYDAKEMRNHQYDTDRTRYQSVDGEKDETYSHDGKLLKESYLRAKERTTSDGYTIKTSQDGKEKWVYKDGQPVNEKVRILKHKDGRETVEIIKEK